MKIPHFPADRITTISFGLRRRVHALARLWVVAALLASLSAGSEQASAQIPLPIPNGSFELPVAGEPYYADLRIDAWQKTEQPVGYDTNVFGAWEEKTGVFFNFPFPEPIDNVDGLQAAFLFSFPGVGFFQDYDSIGSGGETTPSHEFDPVYTVGKGYRLTAGFTTSTSQNLPEGSTLSMRLYYRDEASNRVAVATTTVTYSVNTFTNPFHLLDFHVDVPAVTAEDAWAGQHIGVEFVSNVSFALLGGVWDVDQVRLVELAGPLLTEPGWTEGQFRFTLLSDPGTVLTVLTSSNATLPVGSWATLHTVTNVTGTMQIIDSSAAAEQRYYRVRQLD